MIFVGQPAHQDSAIVTTLSSSLEGDSWNKTKEVYYCPSRRLTIHSFPQQGVLGAEVTGHGGVTPASKLLAAQKREEDILALW